MVTRGGGGDGEEQKQESGSLPSGVQGLGMRLPDLKSKKKGKQKVSRESHVTEALDKLREQTRETVKGLESMSKPGGDDFGKDAMMEDWVKQFEEFSGSQVYLLKCFLVPFKALFISLIIVWPGSFSIVECQVLYTSVCFLAVVVVLSN